MINGLVITHGDLGAELLRVQEMIMGPEAGLASLSNSGKSHTALVAEIGAWLETTSTEADGALLFIDDVGGSCANAAQMAAAGDFPVRILTGINLAMLLDFLTWRESLPPDELARRLVEKGRAAVAELGLPGEPPA